MAAKISTFLSKFSRTQLCIHILLLIIKFYFQEQRAEILQVLLNNKTHVSKDTLQILKFSDIASKTEGYVAQDLNVLVDKATHAAWIRLGKIRF